MPGCPVTVSGHLQAVAAPEASLSTETNQGAAPSHGLLTAADVHALGTASAAAPILHPTNEALPLTDANAALIQLNPSTRDADNPDAAQDFDHQMLLSAGIDTPHLAEAGKAFVPGGNAGPYPTDAEDSHRLAAVAGKSRCEPAQYIVLDAAQYAAEHTIAPVAIVTASFAANVTSTEQLAAPSLVTSGAHSESLLVTELPADHSEPQQVRFHVKQSSRFVCKCDIRQACCLQQCS